MRRFLYGKKNDDNEPKKSEDFKSVHFQEWKECCASVARLDDAILNVRKYGFTFVTILLTADGFIYSKLAETNPPQIGSIFGIYIAMMLLIFGLFRVDRYHEIFLRAAVDRAIRLEDSLKMGEKGGMTMSQRISYYADTTTSATWGVFLYFAFCIANTFLFLGSIVDFGSLPPWLGLVIGIVTIIISAVVLFWRHSSVVNKINEFSLKDYPNRSKDTNVA